ncbi:GxxExxY protein [Marivirga sp.]|uniref:GxxExxY protein n=1 Tax=Marivirga sp. TaxID=2018662 RepID=UPI002D80F885|nr:GxxExxY protein [Marivirga sp.]HET8860355.1 GxxExxY protein [Marivirga sp.]
MSLNDLTYQIRGAIFTVFKELGTGLLESVYEAALMYELHKIGHTARSQVGLPVVYKGIKLELGYKIDVLVENHIIVEIKSVEFLHNVHKKQLLSYLKLSNKKLGLLVNFNVSKLVDNESLVRIIN